MILSDKQAKVVPFTRRRENGLFTPSLIVRWLIPLTAIASFASGAARCETVPAVAITRSGDAAVVPAVDSGSPVSELAAETEPNPEVFLVPVVTPTREKTPLLQSPTTIQVISRQDMDTAGMRTVGEALRTMVADFQYVEGGVSPYFSVRGYSSSSNFNERELILLDGQPLNDAVLATFDLDTIPVADVDHIEVVAGPGSALYGPDAFGGVINIITRRPEQIKKDAGDVYAGSGVFTTEGAVAGSFKKKGERAASWSISGLYNQDPGITSVRNGDVQTDSVRAQLTLPHALTASLAYYGSDVGSVGYATHEPPTPLNRLRSNLTTGLLGWNPTIGTAQTSVKVYGEFGSEAARSELPIGSGMFSYLRAQPATYGVEGQTQFSQGKPGSLLLGFDLRRLTSSGDINHLASNLAAFGEEELRSGRFSPSLGLRYDYHSIYGGHFSPRLAGTYALSPRAYLRASLGSAYRAPNFLELFVPAYLLNQQPPFPVPPVPILITGNPHLKPEDTTAGEVGIRAAIGNGMTLDAAAFNDHVGNLITFVTFFPQPAPGTAPGGSWANTGSQTIRGAELTLARSLGPNARTSLQYVYLDVSSLKLNSLTAVGLPGVAPHHTLTWQTYAEQFHGMSASFILNARSSSEMRGGAVIADATVGRKLRSWLSLQLIAHNLFDNQYLAGQNIPGAGRTVYVRLSGLFE